MVIGDGDAGVGGAVGGGFVGGVYGGAPRSVEVGAEEDGPGTRESEVPVVEGVGS